MDRTEWSLQDAKNHFSSVVEAAGKGTPQIVTKRGKPAVVVLSVAAYERLAKHATQHRPSFVEHLLAMPKDDGEFERINIVPRDIDL